MRRGHKLKKYTKDRGYYGLYVIAVRTDGVVSSPIKIGITDDPVTRLSGLQNGSFLELVLHQHWWLAGKPIAVLVEKTFKEKYKKFNIRGEWFDMEPSEAVKLAARELSDIGPRFYTEDSLMKAMQKEATKAGDEMNFQKWVENTVSLRS